MVEDTWWDMVSGGWGDQALYRERIRRPRVSRIRDVLHPADIGLDLAKVLFMWSECEPTRCPGWRSSALQRSSSPAFIGAAPPSLLPVRQALIKTKELAFEESHFGIRTVDPSHLQAGMEDDADRMRPRFPDGSGNSRPRRDSSPRFHL
ncbi:hypothetical protein GN956_G24934 [Arapaima gigas]